MRSNMEYSCHTHTHTITNIIYTWLAAVVANNKHVHVTTAMLVLVNSVQI